MYYRGAQAAIVVYDIQNQDSFQRAKTWVKELQRQVIITMSTVMMNQLINYRMHENPLLIQLFFFFSFVYSGCLFYNDEHVNIMCGCVALKRLHQTS